LFYALKHFGADESLIGTYTLAMVAMAGGERAGDGLLHGPGTANKIALVIA